MRHRARASLATLSFFAAVTLALAQCTPASPPTEDDQVLDDLDPATLHWVAPLADDEAAVDDPIDFVVLTQNPDAHSMHFAVDGQEVFVCDAADPNQDCFEDEMWNFATAFDTAGPHTVTASFVDGRGRTVSVSRDVDVAEDLTDETIDPSADENGPDTLGEGEQVTEGAGTIVDAQLGARGYLDPNKPLHCGRPPCSRHELEWSVQNGRVSLERGERVDGSVTRIDRCVQRYGRIIARYADAAYVSRASIASWLSTAGDCDPHREFHSRLLSTSRCVATTHALRSEFGGHALDAATCRDRLSNPDFAIHLATAFLSRKSVHRKHHGDPPLIAAVIRTGRARRSRVTRWGLYMPRDDRHFIDRYVGEYNAYRTWEGRHLPDTLRDHARSGPVRLGTFTFGGQVRSCSPSSSDPAMQQCGNILHHEYGALSTTEAFWGHIQPGCAAVGNPAGCTNETFFNFAELDVVVSLAESLGVTLQGNTLLYPSVPQWVQNDVAAQPAANRRARAQFLVANFLRTVISHYRQRYAGRVNPISTWGVVNEIMGGTEVVDPQTGDHLFLTDNWFLQNIGLSYVRDAFVVAHQADPSAQLMFNEKGGWGVSPSGDRYRNMVQYLLRRGTPLHVIGLQMHVTAFNPDSVQSPPSIAGLRHQPGDGYVSASSVATNMEIFTHLHEGPDGHPWPGLDQSVAAAGGLRIVYTELDVRTFGLPASTRVETQRRYYYDVVSACVHNSHCDAIYFWGISDRDSWINIPQYGFTLAGMPDVPLMWNTNYARKPAYCAVREAILGHPYPSNASCM